MMYRGNFMMHGGCLVMRNYHLMMCSGNFVIKRSSMMRSDDLMVCRYSFLMRDNIVMFSDSFMVNWSNVMRNFVMSGNLVVERGLVMQRWHECVSVCHSVCNWHMMFIRTEGHKVRFWHVMECLAVLVQVVVAGQVVLAVVLLREGLVVPRRFVDKRIGMVSNRCDIVLLMRGPGVHRGTLFVVGRRFEMLASVNHRLMCVRMCVARAAVQRQHMMLDIVVLNTVRGLRLDLVEQLVVLVLNIMHQLRALVIINVVAISVATVIGMRRSIVPEVLIRLIVVIVVVAAPVRATLVMVGVMVRLVAMVVETTLVVHSGGMMLIMVFPVDIVPVVLRVQPLVVSLRIDVSEITVANSVWANVISMGSMLVAVANVRVLESWLEDWPVVGLSEVRSQVVLFRYNLVPMCIVDIVVGIAILMAMTITIVMGSHVVVTSTNIRMFAITMVLEITVVLEVTVVHLFFTMAAVLSMVQVSVE